MRALQVTGERRLELTDIDAPGPPASGEVQVAIKAVALNHIDVWGWRGMAFVRRKLPIILGAEAAGEIALLGEGVRDLAIGDTVALYGALTCGECRACQAGRDNFCGLSGSVGNIFGFHIDGFGRELMNIPARLAVPAPAGLDVTAAALAAITFGTPEHMLFDNARLQDGEWVLVHAGGSGIGSAAIQLAKSAGATVITTVGSDEKGRRATGLGADHVVNYRSEAFESRVRHLTGRAGVDVVFEHVGPDTFAGSMFCLKRGGRLVTCGATTGIQAKINLFTLYQQQLRLIGSFGCTTSNMRSVMKKMAAGTVQPVIDTVLPLERIAYGLARLESRDVFGKIIVQF
ncbi:MAG: zinc-binding dehydrogenase [Hyphomicrobiaceae bacterium]|nr:zinc-binding dehydrogenase [Hyphomicrobiaceae bacterium]